MHQFTTEPLEGCVTAVADWTWRTIWMLIAEQNNRMRCLSVSVFLPLCYSSCLTPSIHPSPFLSVSLAPIYATTIFRESLSFTLWWIASTRNWNRAKQYVVCVIQVETHHIFIWFCCRKQLHCWIQWPMTQLTLSAKVHLLRLPWSSFSRQNTLAQR